MKKHVERFVHSKNQRIVLARARAGTAFPAASSHGTILTPYGGGKSPHRAGATACSADSLCSAKPAGLAILPALFSYTGISLQRVYHCLLLFQNCRLGVPVHTPATDYYLP